MTNDAANTRRRWTDGPLLRHEDWLAVWLGFALIGLVVVDARPQDFGLPSAWAGWLPRMPSLKWDSTANLQEKVFAPAALQQVLLVALLSAGAATIGIALLRGSVARFFPGFAVVFGLSWLAQVVAGNAAVHAWGLEYVLFALALGLAISNLLGIPDWLREAVRTEFYIKTGLVILGTNVLFGEMLTAGALGLVQALGVILVVWSFSFWLARRLRVDDEFAAMLSTAVAICGVSAAIAACGAIQGDRRNLSYVTSLVLVVAVPMMVAMPWIIKTTGIPEVVGGAWLGGTLDTSGSVVAAGELISPAAMKAGTVVKMSQNVLIGVAAFFLSLWWAFRQRQSPQERPSLAVIWERFPKFVLGFVAASLLFSFAFDPKVVAEMKGPLNALRNVWFALAFVSIGLETRFAELLKLDGGRPALAFVLAQAFNVVWTLMLAAVLFSGRFVPAPQFDSQQSRAPSAAEQAVGAGPAHPGQQRVAGPAVRRQRFADGDPRFLRRDVEGVEIAHPRHATGLADAVADQRQDHLLAVAPQSPAGHVHLGDEQRCPPAKHVDIGRIAARVHQE